MITISILRQIMRQLLWKIVDQEKIEYDDIRYLKADAGQFPMRITKNKIGNKEEIKTVPYIPESDNFILFDVVPKENTAYESSEKGSSSMWSFDLVVNLYGRDSDSFVQFMIVYLQHYEVTKWLNEQLISVFKLPDEINVVDGFENQQWWMRRRFVINLNIAQSVDFKEKDKLIQIDRVNINVEEGLNK